MAERLYEVVVLVERALDAADAATLAGLHEGVEERVRYHVLLPVEDPVAGVEAAMGQLSTGEVLSTPGLTVPPEVGEELREDSLAEARARVAESVRALEATGAQAVGSPVLDDPLRALTDTVREVDGREVVVVTRPHLVRELLHLDWTSRAERHLDVPVLHLLEHATTERAAD